MSMTFKTAFAPEYVARAPLALALERTLECLILSKRMFPAPLLDVGCGDGLFASLLFSSTIDTGLDLDPCEIECARTTNAYSELLCCPASAIPKPSGTFKTAFSNSVLEHIPELAPVLREVHRVLAPGGTFYFTVPTNDFERYAVITRVLAALGMQTATELYCSWYNRFWRHFHAYSPQQWTQLATEAGFEVLETVRYNSPNMTVTNDFLAPFAAFSSVLKRVTGRWVLAPGFRRWLLRPLAQRWQRALANHGVTPTGSLVLVVARKPAVSTV